MYRRNLINNNRNTIDNPMATATNFSRRIGIRRRLESNRRNGQSLENNNLRNSPSTEVINPLNNTVNQNNVILETNENENRNNSQSSYHSRRMRRYNTRGIYSESNRIKEEIIKNVEICKEENIDNEIKDTVKCYICFEKITKPKMCPKCHRIACEKCLYNWFINLRKINCGFCREKVTFNEMISVPFMDAVVNFFDKFYNNKNLVGNTEILFNEYCPQHKNEILYYYCLDCGKAYCKTCFVFFGEEKDKHIGHSIIEYEKYKNMSLPLLRKHTEKLDNNIKHVEDYIQKCISIKNSYEYERKFGNKFLKKIQEEYNKLIDGIIQTVDDQINKLKEYINEYNKYKKEVEHFYDSFKNKNNNHNDKSAESLIIKLTTINQKKFFHRRDIEKLIDLSKCINFKTYQSKFGQFNHENMFLSKGLKLGNSPYELVIDNSQRNEVQVSLILPKEKNSNINHNFQAFIYIKKKGDNIQTYLLDEIKEDQNCFYLKRKIPSNFFDESLFKIKGVLYDYYIE